MLSLELDSKQITGALGRLAESYPKASAIALNRTANLARDRLLDHFRTEINQPTAYTLRSLWVTYSTDKSQTASVEIIGSDRARAGGVPARYLAPLLFGMKQANTGVSVQLQKAGVIRTDQMAFPAPEYTDQHGNFVLRGKNLSSLVSGVAEKKAAKRGKKGQRAGASYFKSGGSIFQRSKDNAVRPVLYIFLKKSVKRRLRFREIVEFDYSNILRGEFHNALSQYFTG